MNNQINDLFVSYKIAKKLQDLDFQEPCIAWWDKKTKEFKVLGQENIDSFHTTFPTKEIIPAPTYQQVIEWFRKKHLLNIYVIRDGGWWIPIVQDFSMEDHEGPEDIDFTQYLEPNATICCNSYKQAQELAIKVCIKRNNK